MTGPRLKPLAEVDVQTRREIFESAFGMSDRMFWQKIDELCAIDTNPSPAHKAYLDKWFGTPVATWKTGGGECQFCLKPTAGENLCDDCAYRVVDEPVEGYEW